MNEGRPGEITLIFHSDKEQDRKMRSFLETIEGFEVTAVDLKTENLTQEELIDIASKLDLEINDLFDPLCADQAKIGSLKGIQKDEALKLLAHDPMLLSTPIIIIGEHAYQFESSSELIMERRNED
jgi:arsenate reductase-like glutaredoxin family protein